jgi:hypothetical protein
MKKGTMGRGTVHGEAYTWTIYTYKEHEEHTMSTSTQGEKERVGRDVACAEHVLRSPAV